MIELHATYEVFALILGLCIGSFLNVCIARMPEDRSVVRPRSHCPACGAGIGARDNIPLISWVLLRGKCRACGTQISVLYPIIELMMGLLTWVLFHRFIPTPEALNIGNGIALLLMLVFVSMLVAMTFIDVRHYIIPDEFSIYAAPIGILGVSLLGFLSVNHAVMASSWKASFLGATLGGGSLGLIMLLYWIVRREEGMGLGDVKLLIMMGAFLGPLPAIPFILIVSSMAGALVGLPLALVGNKGLRVAIPFGPFLAFAGVLYVLHGPEIVQRHFPGVAFLLH